MAFFNLFSQAFSWSVTILIARILEPGDYGLMAMATIITGYALTLSELGLGNAIIQRKDMNKNHLSSVFWFSSILTTGLAISCFPVSYLTAFIMHEPRVIPITQIVSILFILNGLQIVPSSLLRRDMDFKSIGMFDMISVIVSSACMFGIAKTGGGVWTLILGNIIRSFVRTLLLYIKSGWRPALHFNLIESRPYISFGIKLALGRSIFYVQQRSDEFFAGRTWQAGTLGFYTFALELASIPTNRIVSLINNVSFPAFAKVQHDQAAFNKLYLNITKITAAIVFPLFAGGYLFGGDLITILLDAKWQPIISLFKILCLVQIMTSMIAINNFVHAAQGRPVWSLYFNIACAIAMPLSFFLAVPYGLRGIIIPWCTTYVVLCVAWLYVSIRKFGIRLPKYIFNIRNPLLGTLLMSVPLWLFRKTFHETMYTEKITEVLILGTLIGIGVAVYSGYFLIFDKQFIKDLFKLIKK